MASSGAQCKPEACRTAGQFSGQPFAARRPRAGPEKAAGSFWCPTRNRSGTLAMLAAMRRASSRVSSLAAARWHEDRSLARTRGSPGPSEWARSAVESAFPCAGVQRSRTTADFSSASLPRTRGFTIEVLGR